MTSARQKTLCRIEAALSHASPAGGLCVGLVAALAWQRAEEPTGTAIELASCCCSAGEAEAVYRDAINLEQYRRRSVR